MDKAEDTTNNSVEGKETSSLCKDEKADVVANKGISEDISKQLTDIKPSMSSVIDEKCIQTNEKIYTSVLNKLQNSDNPLDVDMCSKDIKNNDSTSIEKVFDEAIDSVNSIEEGNNSQDEELLLRWEEDDDDIDEGACKDNIDINEDTLLALKDDIESNDIATENHLLEVDDGNDKSMLKNDNTDFTEEIMSGTSGVNDKLVKQSISQELAGKQDLTQRCLESQVRSRLIESSAKVKVYDYTDDKEIQMCGETLYQNTKEGKILDSMDVDEKLSEVDSYIPDEMIYHSKTNLNDKLQDESLLQKEKLKIDAEEASVNNAESSCVIKCCNKIETKECPINKDIICQETCISSSEIGVLEINKMIDVAKPSATSSINCETNIHDIPHITEQNISSDHENKDAKCNEKVIEDKTKSDFMNMSLTIKTDHGLNEPDVMLEIPSQELIDIDELDLSMGQDLTADLEKVMQQSDDAQKDVYGQEEALKFSENLCKKRIKGIDEKGDLECLLKDRELITGSVLSEQQNKLSGNSPKVKLKDASTTAVVRKNSQEDLSGPLTIEIKEDKELITKNTTVCQIPTSTIEDISTDTLKSTTISKSSPEIVSSTVKTLPLTSECIVSTPDSEISTKKNLQSPSKILPPIEGLVFLPETVSSRSEIEPSSSNNKVSTVSQAIITLVSGTSPLTSQTSTSSSEFKLSTIEKISSLTEKTIQGTKLTSTNTEDSTKSVTLEEAISTTNVDSTGSEIVSITSKVALLPPSATGTAGVSSATTASIPKTIPSTSNTAVVLLSQTEPLFDAKGSLVKGSSPLVSEDKPLDSEVITSSFQTLQPTPEALPSEVTSNTEIMSPAVKDLTTSSEDITSSSTDKSVHSEIIHTSKAILQNSEAIPSTSKMLSASDFTTPSTSYSASTSEIVPNTFDAIPSTSTALPGEVASLSTMETDMSDQSLQMQDSLGLLAESSRVREDDDEMDDDECEDDEEMDIDDESSNQMTAEHSEDSNAPHSENEVKEQSKPATVIEEKSVPDDNILDPMCEGSNKKEEIKLKDSNELDKEIVVTESGGNSDTKRKGQKSALDTMKASDVRDTETEGVAAKRKKLEIEEETKKTLEEKSQEVTKLSPNKTMNLKISKACNVFNIVELEESSSEDDIQEVPKDASSGKVDPAPLGKNVMTSVNIPDDVVDTPVTPEKITPAVEMVTTSKTAEPSPSNDTRSDTTAIPPEAKTVEEPPTPAEAKMDLEVFNLDSDEEGKEQRKTQPVTVEEETPQIKKLMKCINPICKGEVNVYFKAETSIVAHYDAKKKKPMVCEVCYKDFMDSRKSLIEGIKNLTPLLELDMGKCSEDLVEISDSESDEEGEPIEMEQEVVGESAAKMLEDNLADLINESWKKYKMDARLKVTTDFLDAELDKLDAEGKEIDRILDECQVATDKLRKDLYTTFEPARKELPSIVICDLPNQNYSCFEKIILETSTTDNNTQVLKFGTASDAIPLTYEPLSQTTGQQNVQESKPTSPVAEKPSKVEEDKDVSVVQLSAEEAPADLPPCGEIVRPPLKVGSIVYGVRNAFGAWLRCKVTEVTPKVPNGTQYTTCSVKFESKAKNPFKVLSARNLAYTEPCSVRMVIGTRIIALFKDSANDGKRESFYSGIVAEIPNPVNNYRYLVFFDDGYAQYVLHKDTRLVCECSPFVWDEVHPFSREFVKKYLLAYPERPMVRLHAGQSLKTEWNGKWWSSRVVAVDASLVQVHFEEDLRSEWIYRGSTRLAPLFLELQAAERHRARPLPRTKAQARTNMPYVEYTRPDEPTSNKTQQQEEIRRQRAVAKKSTVPVAASANTNASANAPPVPSVVESTFTTRVVYYTPKNAVKPYKMLPHQCNKKCKRTDVLGLKELRTYNPLAKPLLSGWERQIVRFKGHREVMYRAPCGRRLRNMFELHKYLRLIHTDMSVDLFDFNPNTHCLAEFVISKCLVGKKDLSHGKENVPVPCVNTLDETLPEFCSYNTERTPTAGVPLNLDPDFLCGCDCTDDCQDKSKCACWQLTLEGAKTIGLDDPNIGYIYKRLPEPLPSGIYECNSRCKCKQTCLNRVAQHPLQLKLQVFKTMNRGWGIRALNDVPAGAFLCVYAGNLLTDATANLDGLNEGDEYLAELDYIEVVEQMKEGFEEDIPEADKKLDKEELNKESSEEESSEDEDRSNNDKSDGDFTPNYSWGDKEDTGLKKSLRKRERQTKNTENDKSSKESSNKEDCITISDDEEVREPARFAPQLGMGANEFISKYKSVRAHFGRDEACYIMDAKVQGNIGRYLNHSCSPNVFVQNVFVDTHDPRFPWVAFFALSHIRAGTELTWNYNYDVGSVPHKVLYCHCQAPNCRGRLL